MTDPSALSEKQENDNMRMMLWYRAVLDLLRKSGFAPEGGETPEAFARRLVQTGAAPEQMIGLTQAVQRQQYACRAPDRTELELAQNVYRRLLIQLPPKDRFSWYIHRLLHGMGNFHQIP